MQSSGVDRGIIFWLSLANQQQVFNKMDSNKHLHLGMSLHHSCTFGLTAGLMLALELGLVGAANAGHAV